MQQDAHEFLNFLINHINEIILGELSSWSYIFLTTTITWLLTLSYKFIAVAMGLYV